MRIIDESNNHATENEQSNLHNDPLEYDELYRPQFHFTARKGLLNGPNGLVYLDGEYHLLYQHNPLSNNWGNMTWGHAISRDLFHWQTLPNALEPDSSGTMFSGCVVIDSENTSGFQTGDGPVLVALYTAAGGSSPESVGRPFMQCLAFSNDRGRTWQKYSGNPVLPHIVGENRDPKVIWYAPGEYWLMTLFLDEESFAFFKSQDLKDWQRIQTLSIPGSECPDFFPIKVGGEQKEYWIFLAANGNYLIGQFDGKKFAADSGPLKLDYGGSYYAMQTYGSLSENDNRRIQIAWMAGGVYPQMPFSQQMSVPNELTLQRTSSGLKLFRAPIDEITALYTETISLQDLNVAPGDNPLADISGDLFDITATIKWNQEDAKICEFGFRIRGAEIRFNVELNTVSCLGKTAKIDMVNSKISVRILLDRASLELFLNGGKLSMSYCFTPSPNSVNIEFFTDRVPVSIISLDVHKLRSTWSPIDA